MTEKATFSIIVSKIETCWHRLTPAKNSPHKSDVFFLFWLGQTKKCLFPISLHSCKLIIFCQVMVLSTTVCTSISTDNDLQNFYIFNCCSSNHLGDFHPELPVIPKPGEFKRLFIWKKTAHETKAGSQQQLALLLDSMLFTSYVGL